MVTSVLQYSITPFPHRFALAMRGGVAHSRRLLMKKLLLLALLSLATAAFAEPAKSADGFISLFDGKTLDGWKASEKEGSFSVQDGKLVVFGPRSHLFYAGEVKNHDFKNFHLRCDVMTFPGANSGFYFHTEWQDSGFPNKGFEVQVNN